MNEDRLPDPVAEALAAWRDAREGVIAELEAVPEDSLDRPPFAGVRSAADLVRHIVATAEMWSHELALPEGDFRRQDFGAFLEEYAEGVEGIRGREALARLSRETLQQGERRLDEAAGLLRKRPIRAFNGEEMSRLAWLNHGIAHEMYHRGQLAWCVRAAGETPALTRKIG